MSEHIIDCNVEPFIPEGLEIERHQEMGEWEFDPGVIDLSFPSTAFCKSDATGKEFEEFVNHHPALNANVLLYLLEHQELIPKWWGAGPGRYDGYDVYFWGTIYKRTRHLPQYQTTVTTRYVLGLRYREMVFNGRANVRKEGWNYCRKEIDSDWRVSRDRAALPLNARWVLLNHSKQDWVIDWHWHLDWRK